jgi:deferrochelatase/peroxidase EfeB
MDRALPWLDAYRRSVPYGTVREHGLYFVAFSADVRR